MSSRTLLNLALAAVVLILGLLVYFKPGLEPEAEPQPLTTVADLDAVSSLLVERRTRDPLAFRKRAGRWYLQTGEHALPAALFQVQALLRLLQATPAASYPADTLELETLGLQPPQASVTIGATTILLGTTEALGNRRYALLDDSVHLLEDRYQHLLNADWSNFIERKLLPAGKTISRLQLPNLSLGLSDDNQWQLAGGKTDASDPDIQRLLGNWNTATALYARRHAGSTTGETVVVEFSDASEPVTFKIVSLAPELILARPDWGIQYHLRTDMSADLFSLGEEAAE